MLRFLWPFRRQPTELQEQRERFRERLARIATLEARNANARAASRLEQLEAAGVPFHSPPSQPLPVPREITIREPVYEADSVTGFPFVPRMAAWKHQPRFEQDPLFGWVDGNAFGFPDMDLSTAYPIGAFPREMFPERPTSLRNQHAQDAIRYQSRLWFETCPQYSGPIGHLRNYIVGSGMTIDVVGVKDDEESEGEQSYEQGGEETQADEAGSGLAEESEANPNDTLAAEIQEYLDAFGEFRFNRLDRRVWESVLNLFIDGEDAIRIYPGAEYPEIRSVDTSTIRGPHNEINGPWAYGVLTSWPSDFEDVQAYHLWHPDNTHETVSPELLHLAKLDTTRANVKRGVPLCYKIRKQLPQMSKLLDCMAVGEAARQAIPYIEQYTLADKSGIRAATPSAIEAYDRLFGDGRQPPGEDIQPGQVRQTNRGMEFKDTPQGRAESGAIAYRTLCEAIAGALNVPLWFVTSTADQETEASAIVAESPLGHLITFYQGIVVEHYEHMLGCVVDLSGRFPADWRAMVELHCELPSLPTRDENAAVQADMAMLEKKLLSPQHFCVRHKLDFDEETDLIAQAEALGWQAQSEIDLLNAQAAQDNGGEDEPPKPSEEK